MSSPRRTVPERTAAPSQSFINFRPNPQLNLTPDVFTSRHFHNRNNGVQYGDSGDGANSDIINDIFNRPRQYSTVNVNNEAVTIRVPCVYNGPNDAIIEERNEDKRLRKSHSSGGIAVRAQSSSLKSVVEPPNQSTKNKFPIREKDKKNAMPPFCSVVRSRSAIRFTTATNSQSYLAQDLKPKSKESKSAVSKIEAKMVWDFEGGKKVQFLAVDYGQELFEQAAATFAAKEMERRMFLRGQAPKEDELLRTSKSSSKSSVNIWQDQQPCHDFSKPRFHTSKNKAKMLQQALADLNNIPKEIEKMVRADKRFEPLIMDGATRKLNIHPTKRVYSNLKLLDPDPSHIAQIQSKVLEEIKSIQPLPRPKDPVPDIMDYNNINYTRIKPKLVPSKPKTPSAVSINSDDKFHLINSEKQIASKAENID